MEIPGMATNGPLLVSFDCDGENDGDSVDADASVVRVWSINGIESGTVDEMVTGLDFPADILMAISFGGQSPCLSVVHTTIESDGPFPSHSRSLKVWNLGSDDLRFSVSLGEDSMILGCNVLVFSQSGNQILLRLHAVAFGLYDAHTGLPLSCVLPPSNIYQQENTYFTSDDSRLIYINPVKQIVVWNLHSGEHIVLDNGFQSPRGLVSHPTSCLCAAITRSAASITESARICVWNWSSETETLLTQLKNKDFGFLHDIQFGSGDDTIISRSYGSLTVWNYSDYSSSLAAKVCCILNNVSLYQMNRMNNTIVTIDRYQQSVCVYDALTGAKIVESRKQHDRLYQGVFCPNYQVVLL